MIIMTVDGTYVTQARGTTLTLKRKTYGWEVCADNSAVRAWRTLGVKIFNTLEDVEKAYKSFYGITKLVEAQTLDK